MIDLNSPEFERFTKNYKTILSMSTDIAKNLGDRWISSEHLLLAILKNTDSVASKILVDHGISLDKIRVAVPVPVDSSDDLKWSNGVNNIVLDSVKIARDFGYHWIGSEHLLMSMLTQGTGKALLKIRSITEIDQIVEDLALLMREHYQNGSAKAKDHTPVILNSLAINLNEKALKGELRPVIGRENEVDKLLTVLGRKVKNNAILIGDAGVGKTAIVEGLAQRIVQKNVPANFKDKVIMMLDMASVVAGTKYRGEFEEKIKKIIKELEHNKNIILLIDEIHTIVGSGTSDGTLDAANILKNPLSRGVLQIIGTTTKDEYHKHIRSDHALSRRFISIDINEPSKEAVLEILTKASDYIISNQNVSIDNGVLEAVTEMSSYIDLHRKNPDKAIDLLDDVVAYKLLLASKSEPANKAELISSISEKQDEIELALQLQDYQKAAEVKTELIRLQEQLRIVNSKIKKNIITIKDIASRVEELSGLSSEYLLNKINSKADQSKHIASLGSRLKKIIIGQDQAIDDLVLVVERAYLGITDGSRPLGSFLFLGPTGVGKSYLASSLALELFGSKDNFIKVDMSEFASSHHSARIVGAPPGYVGHNDRNIFLEKVQKRPGSVILFDEIEKAHSEVHHLMLQILEDGKITDAKGIEIDFSQSIIIMTSNIGAHKLGSKKGFGFSIDDNLSGQEVKSIISGELLKSLSPEFINRLDFVIGFSSLSNKDHEQIFNLELSKLIKRLGKYDLKLSASVAAKKYLINLALSENMGARPMRRILLSHVERVLIQKLVQKEIKTGDKVIIDYQNDKIVLCPKKK